MVIEISTLLMSITLGKCKSKTSIFFLMYITFLKLRFDVKFTPLYTNTNKHCYDRCDSCSLFSFNLTYINGKRKQKIFILVLILELCCVQYLLIKKYRYGQGIGYKRIIIVFIIFFIWQYSHKKIYGSYNIR